MARKNTKVSKAPNQPSAIDVKNYYEKNKAEIDKMNFESANQALKQFRDYTKETRERTISTFNKEKLRLYLQNITNNEKNIRNLSRYLDYRCQPYHRLISYNASMFCMNARSVIPQYDLVKIPDKKKFLKSYNDTLHILDRMNLQYEFGKIANVCFREDVFFGIKFFDETGMIIFPLNPDNCKIIGQYQTGDFAAAIDMSTFKSSEKQLLIENLGEPLKSMYKSYGGNNTNKWQVIPDEYCCCFKARPEDWETICCPMAGILNSLLNLIDMEDIQAIADQQQIYKMVWLELETLTNSNQPDDWKVSPDLVMGYFNRMLNESLPSYISGAVIPGKLQSMNFNNDQASDVNKLAKTTETVLNTSGGAQILNSGTINGTTAFTAAIEADTQLALSSLLPQFQAWVNRMLSYEITNPSKVIFFKVSPYTMQTFKKNLIEDGQYGLPVRLAINSLNNFSELDTLSLNYLEVECLNLNDKFIPMQSSHTQSANNNEEKQKKDVLTDEGEASIDKRDNKN